MTNVQLNGIDFYFERIGSGPRLLFCNGSGATLADVAPLLAELGKQFDVAAADQRGLGRTSLPPAPYAMADVAADVVALTDHLGWASFSVLGISFGGMVAQELAVTVPGRIERLALLCTSSGGAGGSSYPLHTLADMDPADRASRLSPLLDTRFTPEWLASHDADRALVAGAMDRRASVGPTRLSAGRRCRWRLGAGTTFTTGCLASAARPWSRPVCSTALPHRPTAPPSPIRSRTPNSANSTVATRSSCRTQPRSRRSSHSSKASEPGRARRGEATMRQADRSMKVMR